MNNTYETRHEFTPRALSNYPCWLIHLGVISIWFVFFTWGFVLGAYVTSVLMLFYLVGQAVRKGLLPMFGIIMEPPSIAGSLLLDVLMSFILTTAISVVLSFGFILTQFNTVVVMCSVMLVPVILWAYSWIQAHGWTNPQKADNMIIDKMLLLAVSGVLLLGIVFSILRMMLFPWPKVAGTDTFSHLAVINQILYSGGTAHIFGSYPYGYHSVIVTLCHFSRANPLWVINNIHLFLFPFSLLVTLLFLVSITKNTVISVLAVCCTFAVYEHGGLLATYYPYPVAFSFVVVYILYSACFFLKPSKANLVVIIAGYILAIICYPAVILVSAPLLAYLLVTKKFIPSNLSFLYGVSFGGIIVGAFSLIITVYGILPYLDIVLPPIQIGVFTLSMQMDFALLHFTLAYSTLQTLALLAGVFFCAASVATKKRMDHSGLEKFDYRILSYMGIAYLLVFFVPITFAYRTELFIRPLYSLFIVLGIAAPISVMCRRSDWLLKVGCSFRQKNNWKGTAFTIFVISLFLLPVCYEKLATQTAYLLYGENRNLEIEELNALLWIQDHTTPGDYILTDMATGFYMRGVVFRNASTSFMLLGQATSPYSHPGLANLIFAFINSTEEKVVSAYEAVQQELVALHYASSVSYVLISPRTNAWLKYAREGRVSRTAPFMYELSTDDPAWTKFSGSEFVCVFSSGDVRVLQLNATG